MFIFKKHISRRTVLKGAGVTLALPFLEAMVPAATALAQTAANPKIRAGFFYIPHGAVQFDTKFGAEGDRWTPSGSGADFKLNKITASLEPFKKYVSSIGNLENNNRLGRAHAESGHVAELPADRPRRSIRSLPRRSVRKRRCRPWSWPRKQTNQQAAGYGTATTLLSFRDANTSLPTEYNPKKVFNALFGSTTPKERVLNARESDSLLDMILDAHEGVPGAVGARRSRKDGGVSGERARNRTTYRNHRVHGYLQHEDSRTSRRRERQVRQTGRSHVRSARDRVPGGHYPRRHVPDGGGRHEPDLQPHRCGRFVPSHFPPCQRAGENCQGCRRSRPGTWSASPTS